MKSNNFLKVLFLSITILLSIPQIFSVDDNLQIFSPNYFNEQAKIYDDIHYLENEFLSFKFCTDELAEEINVNLVHGTSKISIDYYNYEDKTKGCYYANYDLDKLSFEDFTLEINYKLNKKEKQIKRTFKTQKQSKLINYILSEDYNSLSPTDLSYYLLVQSDFETINSKKSTEIYELLKNARNNEEKCWGGSSCSLVSSSLVLKNILVTGYNLNSRLLEDGKTYIERKLINNQKNPIKMVILIKDLNAFNNNTEVKCEVKIDDENLRTYIFSNKTMNLSKQVSTSLQFTCNQTLENIQLTTYNLQNNINKVIDNKNTNTISYNLEKFSCLGELNTCDFTTSLYSLISYGSTIKDSGLIDSYLNSYILETEDETYINTASRYEDTGKYLYYKSNPDMLNYLKFKQNNDGSWGQNTIHERILQTSWAVLGIQKTESNSEYVLDGKKWIYYNEPLSGWGTIEKNTLAYMAIKEQIKPYLKINAENKLTETTIFTIKNPTIYELKNIKLKFSENINNYLSYSENLGELNGQESLIYNVTLDKNFFGKVTGEMTITGIDAKNRELTLIKMPISIEGQTPFTINVKPYVISEDSTNILIELTNNIEEFNANCTYTNPFDNQVKNVELSHLTKNIIVENSQLKIGDFDFLMKCKVNNIDFDSNAKLNVVISEKKFEIAENSLTITDTTDFKISLTNLDLDKQTVSIEIGGDYTGAIEPTEKDKIIAKDETREIYFTVKNPVLLQILGNTSKGEIIIKSETGYVKKIPLFVNLPSTTETKKFSFNWIYVTLSIIVLFVLVIIVLRYKRAKENEEHEQNHNSHEEEYI